MLSEASPIMIDILERQWNAYENWRRKNIRRKLLPITNYLGQYHDDSEGTSMTAIIINGTVKSQSSPLP